MCAVSFAGGRKMSFVRELEKQAFDGKNEDFSSLLADMCSRGLVTETVAWRLFSVACLSGNEYAIDALKSRGFAILPAGDRSWFLSSILKNPVFMHLCRSSNDWIPFARFLSAGGDLLGPFGRGCVFLARRGNVEALRKMDGLSYGQVPSSVIGHAVAFGNVSAAIELLAIGKSLSLSVYSKIVESKNLVILEKAWEKFKPSARALRHVAEKSLDVVWKPGVIMALNNGARLSEDKTEFAFRMAGGVWNRDLAEALLDSGHLPSHKYSGKVFLDVPDLDARLEMELMRQKFSSERMGSVRKTSFV